MVIRNSKQVYPVRSSRVKRSKTKLFARKPQTPEIYNGVNLIQKLPKKGFKIQ